MQRFVNGGVFIKKRYNLEETKMQLGEVFIGKTEKCLMHVLCLVLNVCGGADILGIVW